MRLGIDEYFKIERKVIEIIKQEMMSYNRIGELSLYLSEIKMYDRIIGDNNKNEEISILEGKIVVIGQSKPKEKHLLGIAKDLGFEKNQFEFYLEYEDIEKYNFERLKNDKYSLVIVGPMGHKQKNINGYSSMIQRLKSEAGFPEIIELYNGSELKISNSNFREALEDILDKYEDYMLN